MKTVDFSETIEACDLKVGRYRQLIDIMNMMKVCEWLIINSAQMKKFPYHRFSAKPAHRLSTDSVFTHQCNPFVMSLPIVNTSKYQLVYTLTNLTFDGFI